MNNYPVALVVDDDIWMQRILSKILEGLGFTPIVASNGFDGVAAAVEKTPTVIFLDIMMPELSGHLTLKLFKKIHVTKDTPIIVVSALSDSENLGLAVKMGAVGFVSKPFTRVTILNKLVSVMGQEIMDAIMRHEFNPSMIVEAAKKKQQAEASVNEAKTAGAVPLGGSTLPRRYTDDMTDKKQVSMIKDLLLKKK